MTQCPRCGKDNPAEIHTCTPPALRLADELEMWTLGEPAAAELRRLHAENVRNAIDFVEQQRELSRALNQRDELLAALKQARGEVQYMASGMTHSAWRTKQAQDAMVNIDAAIAKVKGGAA